MKYHPGAYNYMMGGQWTITHPALGSDLRTSHLLGLNSPFQVKFQNPAKRELKGRQLQTIELQGNEKLRVSFVKFSLKNNYDHKGNQFNQVGLMGISVWGKVKPEPNKAGGLKQRKTEAEMDRVPRRQDLAFLMYTDKDVAEVIFFNLPFEGLFKSSVNL